MVCLALIRTTDLHRVRALIRIDYMQGGHRRDACSCSGHGLYRVIRVGPHGIAPADVVLVIKHFVKDPLPRRCSKTRKSYGWFEVSSRPITMRLRNSSKMKAQAPASLVAVRTCVLWATREPDPTDIFVSLQEPFLSIFVIQPLCVAVAVCLPDPITPHPLPAGSDVHNPS